MNSPGNPADSGGGSAESGAQADPFRLSDPDLALLIDTWHTLPEPIKAAILALVRVVAVGRDNRSLRGRRTPPQSPHAPAAGRPTSPATDASGPAPQTSSAAVATGGSSSDRGRGR